MTSELADKDVGAGQGTSLFVYRPASLFFSSVAQAAMRWAHRGRHSRSPRADAATLTRKTEPGVWICWPTDMAHDVDEKHRESCEEKAGACWKKLAGKGFRRGVLRQVSAC